MTTVSVLRRYSCAALLFGCVVSTGCSQYIDPNVPEPIRPYVEPEFGREYLVYRPSSYSKDYAWPLIVICHSAFPDSPNRRIRAWTRLAEDHGFVVAAPKLEGNRKSWAPKAARQISLQRDDEKRILAAIRHIRAAHNISEDRIFIHGFSGGAHVALHTGLRHPEVFRAIALSQPGFEEAHLADAAGAIDFHQPVFVHYSVADAVMRKHARRCVEWLRSQGAKLTENPHGPGRDDDTERSVRFFEEVLRTQPWIHIRALPARGGNPLEIQFKLRRSCEPTQYRWEFGDGDESPLAEPVHAYAAPGTYRVTVTVDTPSGGEQQRRVRLTLPEGTLGTVGSATRKAMSNHCPTNVR